MNAILAVNAGSSSLKFALYEAIAELKPLCHGEIAGIGNKASMRMKVRASTSTLSLGHGLTAEAAVDEMVESLNEFFPELAVSTIAHRIVHGGPRYGLPTLLTDTVMAELEKLDPLAPQHQPFNLAMVRKLRERYPAAVPVGCFDTAFHRGWSDTVRHLALPRAYHCAGIRRYGFHGLSYEYLTGRVRHSAPLARRVVLAHLGSGASVCATLDGRSVDSTMGFSVLDGLPMSTRCGRLDPGVIFHLHREYGLSFEAIEATLYSDSGLKGISGFSGDMRELIASSHARAGEAVDVFVDRCVGAIGEMTAKAGGIDALVFSGGIGTHAAPIRARVCRRLAFLGMAIDEGANVVRAETISSPFSRIPVFVFESDEQIVMARHAFALTQVNAVSV